ncbi:MAG TPA: methionyl-tRNA formyltransferase [Thermohalobaculum sp.]|nr:methionyl-tRNA formyltransferase [Thermohalobaculum sp.]
MRLAFLGTPDFAVPTLRRLAERHVVARVYTQPARPAGRGKASRPSPVARAAEELGLAVETPESFRDPAVLGTFEALAPDLAVVVAYGQILPARALDVPRLGAINLHASLLPRWRGAAPIQRAIIAGDTETGVCAMQMTPPLDAGPVYARAATPIGPEDTAGTLHDRLSTLGADLMAGTVEALAEGRAEATPQPEQGVTYAAKIEKAEARLDWTRPGAELARLVRGLSPFPGAWTTIAGQRVKLLMAHADDGVGPPGSTLDDRLLVACGDGALRPTRLQREGRAPQAAADFLNGLAVPAGTRLV